MNKLPHDIVIYEYSQLIQMAEEAGWPIKAQDVEHALIFNNIDSVFSRFSDQLLMREASVAMGVSEELEQILFEWPAAKEGTLNLALYLTRIFPSNDGTPLLDICIKSAVEHYTKMTKKMFDEGAINLPRQIQSFIVGLTRPIPEVLSHTIYGELNENEWFAWPALSEPVFDWVARHNLKRILLLPNPSVNSEDSLLARIQVTHTIFGYQTLKQAKLDWAQIIRTETYN